MAHALKDERRWLLRAPRENSAALTSYPALSPVVRQLLANRGLIDSAAVAEFLDPEAVDLADPRLLPDIDRAVDRILRSIRARKRLIVHGDYDADGLAAAALLAETITRLGGQVETVIPHRVDDGYGLSVQAVERAAEVGIDLVVTVDCGVTAVQEIERANELGVDVVITDHHLPQSEIPKAHALVDPFLPGNRYPNAHLTGAGVAHRLASELMRVAGVPTIHSGTDLAAIGTVADVASLLGENRTIVTRGLRVIAGSPRPGLAALRERGRDVPVDANYLAFSVIPRLNAAGRVGDPMDAYQLLMASTLNDARPIAAVLEQRNTERQLLTTKAVESARNLIDSSRQGPLLLHVSDIPLGIVGLVAGQLSRDHRRVVFVTDGGSPVAVGSGRSGNGANVVEILEACGDLLERFGGHAGAAGFALQSENLALLEERLASMLDHQPAPSELLLDAVVGFDQITFNLVDELGKMEPFGKDNPEPLLLARGIQVEDTRVVGRRMDHLQMTVRDASGSLPVIAFGLADRRPDPGSRIDLAFKPEIDSWNGRSRLRLRATAIRPAGPIEMAY